MQVHQLKHDTHTVPDLRGLLLVGLAAGWLVGILTSAWLLLPPLVPLLAGILALLLLCAGWRQPVLRLGGLLCLCLCLGAWRYAAVDPANDPHAIRALLGSNVQVQGEIADDPRLASNSTLLIVTAQSISLDQGQSWQAADGQIQVQILGATFDDPYAPHYGDTLQFTGKLNPPPGYTTPEIQASMTFPQMTIRSRSGNLFLTLLYQARTILAGILLQALPQPFAALLIAIFLSLHTSALKPLLSFFNVTGTAHLVAPSGFKVTLLSGFISNGLRWSIPQKRPQAHKLLPAERRQGNWRRWLQTLLLILCIASYTVLSGGGPAALRAGIMGGLLPLAPRLGRFYNVYTAMALAVLLISLSDPFVIWDTGFLLSFLGTLGILLFTPFFQYLLRFLNHLPFLGFYVAEIIAVTLAASVATLPIFALSFRQISFIAPLANLATVPLLGLLLALGALICLSGLIALPLALICGWLAWPLLWYVTRIISWCAQVPGAYLVVDNLSPLAAWTYYALLALLAILLFTHWRPTIDAHQHTPFLTRRARLLIQCTLALLTLLSTGILAQTIPTPGHLTITLLSSGDPTQGQALFLRAPDGQTALIDEGASSATLAQTLDALLPFWQRSLGLVILSDTSPNNLAGLQDVVTRYQVQRVIDAGMLHPNLAYARWRTTLDIHNLSYTQVHQGDLITLDQQVSLQVLWPPAQLHKSSDETHDNALVLRLLAPNLRLLFLDSSSLSKYALQTLTNSLAPTSLQAEIVQLSGEAGKTFPGELAPLLTIAQPSLLLLTTTPTRKRKNTAQATATPTLPILPTGPWKIVYDEQASSLELQNDEQGWKINLSG